MEIYVNTELIWPVFWWGILACIVLEITIWSVNIWWENNYPGKRHPFSPAFTAAGVLIVLTCSSYLIPPDCVRVVLSGFVVYGGIMWALHAIRWWIRSS